MFQNDGSPTRVTRFKVAPNMADPISIKDTDSRLKGNVIESLEDNCTIASKKVVI